jgi:hypothetical protein
MSDKVDALFDGDPLAPPVPAEPRLRSIRGMLWVGVPLVVLGVPCWTSVPGAVLSLWAWLSTDAELPRIEAGEYSAEDAGKLLQLRRLASGTLVLCVVTLILQIFLLNTRFYERLWGSMVVVLDTFHAALGL